MAMNRLTWTHVANRNTFLSLSLARGIRDVKSLANNRSDLIGPPDPVSNLRPIIFARSNNETKLEKEYRERRESIQNWNQEFWSQHNTRFITERKSFQESQKQSGITTLTADEMSVFYKQFLDKNWQTHLNYNISWYKKNIGLLLMEIRVKLSKLGMK